jgi:hypothetical protein
VAVDPFEELLLGPTYATSKVLRSMNLNLTDIDVLEIHEAFAGQVLSHTIARASRTRIYLVNNVYKYIYIYIYAYICIFIFQRSSRI